MKTSRKTGKPAAKKNNGAAPSRSRRMEPIKGKVSKNVTTDEDEDDDPEMIEDESFKGFDDFYGDEDEDED